MNPDEIHAPVIMRPEVVSYPRGAGRYWLTEAAQAELAALDAADLHSRAVAARATVLARQRRSQQIDGAPPASL